MPFAFWEHVETIILKFYACKVSREVINKFFFNNQQNATYSHCIVSPL